MKKTLNWTEKQQMMMMQLSSVDLRAARCVDLMNFLDLPA